ncbi:NHLP leader peptide family RiPP precursor [Scytonema sp. NUACC26]|uniref:NHLP leader peptide family RiPP precursor n=1 Tax=Scytonema sp. NUACC26 TaxID=3140176 RepID=UPI0034DCB8FE
MTAQSPQNDRSEETRKDFEIRLIAKAWTDEAFRQQLLSNPKAVVEQELGSALPEGTKVEIIPEPANTLCIVLPLPAKPQSSEQLNDEELEAVAGGVLTAVPMAIAGYGIAAPWGRLGGNK